MEICVNNCAVIFFFYIESLIQEGTFVDEDMSLGTWTHLRMLVMSHFVDCCTFE